MYWDTTEMSRSPGSREDVSGRAEPAEPVWTGSLTAVVLPELVLDHAEPVSAGHQVGRHHHRVHRPVPHRLVRRDAALGAKDAEALHSTSHRSGHVVLHTEP